MFSVSLHQEEVIGFNSVSVKLASCQTLNPKPLDPAYIPCDIQQVSHIVQYSAR